MTLFTQPTQQVLILIGLLTSFCHSQVLNVPSNWPTQEMQMGFVWAATDDWQAIDENAGSLNSYYTYRFMDLTWMTEVVAQGAISDMVNEAASNNRPAHPGVIMQLFYDAPIDALARQDRKDALLRKMNNASEVAKFFNILFKLSSSVNVAANKKAAVVLEPDTWGYILQARFHLESVPAAPALEAGLVGESAYYANALNFPAKVNYQDLAAAGIDPYYADKLVGFTSDVKGLARAMVAMAKQLMPNSSIAIPAKTWAIYADGCSGTGKSNQDGNSLVSGLIDVQGESGIVTWGDSDIELAAFSYVKFLRELYGWDTEGDQYLASNWPDLITVQRGGLDAGLVWLGVNQSTDQGMSYPATDPAAGTSFFFWTQSQMDKWLSWAKVISHGTRIPLIGLNVPVGNGLNTSNVAFNYQDTFMDWLFSSNHWSAQNLPSTNAPASFNAGNFARFKAAGFVGLWIGAVGWPAVGTHYGNRSSNNAKGGPSGAMSGDGGWAIDQFEIQDRSFVNVPVDFNEAKFDGFTGFCDVIEAEAKASLTGNNIAAHVEGDKSTEKLFSSKGLDASGNVINNAEALTSLKDSLSDEELSGILSNNLLMFVEDTDGNLVPIIPGSTLASGEVLGANDAGLGLVDPATGVPLAGGQISDVNQGFTPEMSSIVGQFNNMFLNLDITIPQMAIVKNSSVPYSQKVKAIWPLEYQFNIFDNLGQYVAGISGVIGEEDLIKLSKTESNNLLIPLRMKIQPYDENGRHIGTGVYYLRGYFAEVGKYMCSPITTIVDPITNQLIPKPDITQPSDIQDLIEPGECLALNPDPSNPTETIWEKRVLNGITITESFGYTRAE